MSLLVKYFFEHLTNQLSSKIDLRILLSMAFCGVMVLLGQLSLMAVLGVKA
jgi:hypothetical protein